MPGGANWTSPDAVVIIDWQTESTNPDGSLAYSWNVTLGVAASLMGYL